MRYRCKSSGTKTMQNQTSVAKELRPIVLLVTAISLTVATLLITTASLGASPINSMEVASLGATI
jgi:hypothetical protein